MNSDTLVHKAKEFLNTLIDKILELAPSIILAAVVFMAGLFIAWLTQKLIRSFILYLDRNINEKLKARLLSVDLKSTSRFLGRTSYWIIIILTIAIVTHILGLPVITAWFAGLVTYLPNLVAAIIIVFTGIIAGKLVGDLVSSTSAKAGISKSFRLGKFVQYMFLIISILIAIDQIGIDIQFLTITLTIILATLLFGVALAFGLGAQHSVKNILGIYYAQKLYQVGNKIRIGNIEGVIIRITPTSVLIDTEIGQVTVPGKDFTNKESTLIRNK